MIAMLAMLLRASVALLMGFALGTVALGQRVTLVLNKPVGRELGAGETQEFTIEVKAGQFFHVVAEQKGVDIVLTLVSPTGGELFSTDSSEAFGFEHASARSKDGGIYLLKVQALPGSLLQGKYVLELRTLRSPKKADLLRIQGEELLRAAISDQRIGTKESKLRAIEGFLKADALWRSVHERYLRGLGLNSLGDIYSDLGENRRALECYQKALSIERAVGDLAGEANTLNGAGDVYSDFGETKKALAYYQRGLAIQRVIGDRGGEASSMDSIGVLYSDIGDNRQALEYYQQALPIARAMGDRERESTTLNNLGLLYSDLGENQKALENYQQALDLERALGDQGGEATTLNNLGLVYAYLDQNQKALEYYQRAFPIFHAVGDRDGESTSLQTIGNVYADLGENLKSLEYYQQALLIRREIGDRAGEATALNIIGQEYLELGEKQKALEYFQQALPIQRAIGDRDGEAASLISLGRYSSDVGEKQKALEYFQQALPILRAVGNRFSEASTFNRIGLVYSDLGERQKALAYFGQALPIRRAVGDRAGEASTLNNLMRLLQSTQPDLAILFGKQAVNVLQGIRRDNHDLEESLRGSYEKKIESNYRSLADLLIERSRFGEAEEVLNLLKSKEAADFLRSDSVTGELRAATLLDFEKKALDRYEHIVNQIVVLGQQKSALLTKSDKASLTADELAESTRLDRDLDAANTVLRRFFDDQEKAFAADSGLAKRVQEFKDAEGLQDTLQKLGPDVVAIYTLVTPDKYVAMLVTSAARRAYTSKIPEAVFNKKIFEFRQALQDPDSDPIGPAEELYRIIFPEGLRPDLDALQAKTIMWSIDNTLRYVPIAALHDGKDYLVKTFRNSIITPASLANLTEDPSREWEGVGFGVSEGTPTLPAVPMELRGIFREQPGGASPVPGSVRLNADFTRANFEQDLRRQHNRVVHIATHFYSRPGTAANSSLLLGDGLFSLAEIEAKTRLFNGVDILTLSACNTAFTNRNEDGREVDSFGTVAQRLGAKAVIASLWSVSDSSTARLMQEMYRLRQKSGIAKTEALRQSQLALLTGQSRPTAEGSTAKSAIWSHPFYWAPFILIGNWK